MKQLSIKLVFHNKISPEFSVGPLEGLKVGLVGLGPLNWVGQKVSIFLSHHWLNNRLIIQVIRGVISENISYILLVQGKELIRCIDLKKFTIKTRIVNDVHSIPDISHFFSTEAIFGWIFLHTKARYRDKTAYITILQQNSIKCDKTS